MTLPTVTEIAQQVGQGFFFGCVLWAISAGAEFFVAAMKAVGRAAGGD